ncbi:Protein lin-7 C [Desmophyllum pertusum]|uniref:Protein lin-7 C n=1 Tax=Desmophyllum pertusum TaxID=174260 RepID=A0A9W9YNE1_9CNID|nr:Protein lin-7 C [Desmophyllum pertusum]
MHFKSTLVVCLILCYQISCVAAASECTGAILASVFGTLGTLLVIAAIAALVWYCCRKRSGTLSSGSSVDTASEPELSLGAKTKGGDIGLNGHGTPVTFSHRYSEDAPSAAYNTKGVINPAFGDSREVLIDMPNSHHDGEVKIDMDGGPSFKPPAHKGDVKIDMGGDPVIKPPTGEGDVHLDMDWDPPLDMNLSDGNRPDLTLPDGKPPGIDLPDGTLSGSGFPSGSLPGADADVVINGPSKPTFNVDGPKNMETVDVDFDRPKNGGFGLLIARDKTLPPPALFVREVTPGGIAAKTGLIDKGDKIIGIDGIPIEGMPHDRAMSLLRSDEKPKLQLTLLKNAQYKGKDVSLDLPGGSMEESCKIDMEPVLEAGVPSVDIEGMQGDAPDLSTKKPGFDMSGPQVDIPDGKMETRVAGPNVNSNIDLNGPSSGLNLPSTKTKRGKCFSCASGGEKDEPYSKGKANTGLDLDRPNVDGSIDATTGGKIDVGSDDKELGLRTTGPNIFVPSTSASGKILEPSVDGKDIDWSPKAQLDTNVPDMKTPEGKLRTQISGPDVDVSSRKLRGSEE